MQPNTRDTKTCKTKRLISFGSLPRSRSLQGDEIDTDVGTESNLRKSREDRDENPKWTEWSTLHTFDYATATAYYYHC